MFKKATLFLLSTKTVSIWYLQTASQNSSLNFVSIDIVVSVSVIGGVIVGRCHSFVEAKCSFGERDIVNRIIIKSRQVTFPPL